MLSYQKNLQSAMKILNPQYVPQPPVKKKPKPPPKKPFKIPTYKKKDWSGVKSKIDTGIPFLRIPKKELEKVKPFKKLDPFFHVDPNKLTNVDLKKLDYRREGVDTDMNDLIEEMVTYFENNINKMFKKKRDISIAFAIVELLQKREENNFTSKMRSVPAGKKNIGK